MSDRPEFVEGEVYRYEEIAPYTFPAKGSNGIRTPGMLFRYCCDSDSAHGYFEEVVEPENPLVDSMVAQKAIEDLRSKGLTFREISRLAGVSVEAVHRSSGGVGASVRALSRRSCKSPPWPTSTRRPKCPS